MPDNEGSPKPDRPENNTPQSGAPRAAEIRHSAPPGERDLAAGPRRIARQWGLFVLVGFVLYLALYGWSEWLVYRHGEKNRFFMIETTPPQHFDYVVLGASHAMPLGFDDMNAMLEAESGSKVMNLSIEGGGVLPGGLLLDYFLTRHTADRVLWVLDSFAFYSRQWNENRLEPAMLQRAPLDLDLVRTLWRHDWARDQIPLYLTGVSKINNHDRFQPDLPDSEVERFDRVYRPVPQIDRQRIGFLYPDEVDPEVRERYFRKFQEFVEDVRARGMEFVVVTPPTPPRYRDILPAEDEFQRRAAALVDDMEIAFRDFSEAVTEDQYFYDTDHLNRAGVEVFIQEHLAGFLDSQSASSG